jgi:hypothetical protein
MTLGGAYVKIEDYSFGAIRIGGHTYKSDIIIYPNRITEWWREKGHLLQTVDVSPLLPVNPETLVIGTGYYGSMRVSPDVEKLCAGRGIELIARPTTEAWQIYNRLVLEGEKTIVAALHLTC